MIGPCLLQLVAFVVTFEGPNSIATFNGQNKTFSDSSMTLLIQFKTALENTQIMGLNHSSNQKFSIVIKYGFLQILYDLDGIGNGTVRIDKYAVNTNEWFLINITSLSSTKTHVRLIKNTKVTPLECVDHYDQTVDVDLIGSPFLQLVKQRGIQIGGEPSTVAYRAFEGCISHVSLGHHTLRLYNQSTNDGRSYLDGWYEGISPGCACPVNKACRHGVYMFDRTMNTCLCKCKVGYEGKNCENETSTINGDDVDLEFVGIVVAIVVGALILVILVACCIYHAKNSTTTAFGVYNPREQEKVHGQQLQKAFTIPAPEKLI